MIRFRRSNLSTTPGNIIYYTGTSKITPSPTTGFGATYLASESVWDSATGEGVLVFDGDITSIPASAFRGKTGLLTMSLPDSVQTIEAGAFRMDSYTSTLQSINLGEGLKTIGNRSFMSNRKLQSMRIPDSVEHIHAYAFNTCPYIAEYTIGEGLKSFIDSTGVDSNNASGVCGLGYYTYKINWNAINCQDFVRSSQSPFTSDSMFGAETESNPIKQLVFGDRVQHIPAYLMWKAQNLSGCLDIPESCTSIGDRCFQACTKLKTVICRPTTPPLITPGTLDYFSAGDGQNAILRQYVNNAWSVLPITLYVPAESVNAYKTDANWKIYSSLIQPMLEYGEIDLGLRTSEGKRIIFSDRNVGATGPWAIGKYFAWGETTGATVNVAAGQTQGPLTGQSFAKNTYEHSNSTYTTMNKYNATDNYTVLEAGDDAATVHMGSKWRTVSAEELNMLLDEDKFTMEILDTNGQVLTDISPDVQKAGIRFISKIPGFEGKSVVFPACGAGVDSNAKDVHLTVSLWTNSLVSTNVQKAHFLYFYITGNNNISILVATTDRYYGRQVRGVKIV